MTPDNNQVISAGTDRTIRIWDAKSGALLRTLPGLTDDPVALAILPGGSRIISGCHDGSIQVWDAASGALLRAWQGPRILWAFAISPEGKRLVLGGLDKAIQVWDLEDWTLLRTMVIQAFPRSLAASRGAGTIASIDIGDTASIWDERRSNPTRLEAKGFGISISDDGSRAVFGDKEGLKIWDVEKAAPTDTLKQDGIVGSMAVSRDQKRLVSRSYDGSKINVWDIEKKILLSTLPGSNTIAISSDGNQIVTGAKDGAIAVLDAVGGRLLSSMATGPASTVTIRPDGTFWVDSSDGLSRLRLVRGNVSQPIPDDYSATFLRGTPFDDGTLVAR